MTDAVYQPAATRTTSERDAAIRRRLKRRNASETRFRALGLGAIIIAVGFVAILFGSLAKEGIPAFWQAKIHLNVDFDPAVIDLEPFPERQDGQSIAAFEAAANAWRRELAVLDWSALVRDAMLEVVPEAAEDPRALDKLVSGGERYVLRDMVLADPALIGTSADVTLLADANVDTWLKGDIDRSLGDGQQQLSADQRRWADALYESGVISMGFSSSLFTNVDSRSSPASAGLLGAFMGSLIMMIIVIVLAVPIGVAGAIYLEEFAPKTRMTDFIEVNINNLAAVPSIVFGILGAAVFINYLGLPLSAPLAGGLVLVLMTLPTIIIATRSALRAVPPSIRSAALGIGASRSQTVFHHVLPLSLPGILTATIIGVAQALGETAPLLLIGMDAFVANVPTSPMDQSTALPVQIFLWQANENRNFFEPRTSAAIIILLVFMLSLNAIAILLRQRFQRRW
jgi:phosphate transport system permease protein